MRQTTRTLARSRHARAPFLALLLFLSSNVLAAESRADGTHRLARFIPFVGNNPCADEGYRQLAASLPLAATGDGGDGHPWRAMYGLCIARKERLSLHQDWVISYLDVEPQGDLPGGDGVSFGTELSFQWQHEQGRSLAPYYEVSSGVQYAARTAFPAHGGRWMFITNAGAGLLFPLKSGLELRTALRYMHLSNAGVFRGNAGYDGIHAVVSVRWKAGGSASDAPRRRSCRNASGRQPAHSSRCLLSTGAR